MKSLMSAARRGALLTVTGVSALALASCSAGQITQTSSQVAAVDGAGAETADNTVAVRDVTIHVTEDGEAGLKFTAINQDKTNTTHTLRSVTVGGETVELGGKTELGPQCSLVADLGSEIAKLTEPKDICITHIPTSITNPGFAASGTEDVVFTFDSGEIEMSATVSEPLPKSGSQDRVISEHSSDKHEH